ncbi:MAG: T9SS type A sorting domain-containing protein [Ignavibacteriae bacterium]|nr:T9SS type A sorting domain-containing protein [Ignavibacteriota bacterium]
MDYKNRRIYFVILALLLLTFVNNNKLQSCATNGELEVKNMTTHQIIIQIYPISVVFNKRNTNNLLMSYQLNTTCGMMQGNHDYITGVRQSGYGILDRKFYYLLNSGERIVSSLDYIKDGANDCIIGRGKYKIEVIHLLSSGIEFKRDSCTVEFDYYTVPESPGDLCITVTNKDFEYLFDNHSNPNNPVYMSKGPQYHEIQCWRPGGPDFNPVRPKRLNALNDNPYEMKDENFDYTSCNYEYFPIDSRLLSNRPHIIPCDEMFGQNHEFPIQKESGIWKHNPNIYEDRQGDLNMNLRIKKDVSTYRDNTWIYEFPLKHMIPLTINSPATLSLDAGKTYTCNRGFEENETVNPYENSNFYFTVKNGAFLEMLLNSEIILNPKTHLILEYGSHVNAVYNSNTSRAHIFVNGGTFCNQGAILQGRLWIRCNNPIQLCATAQDNIIFNDSVKIQLADSCVFEIPNNKSLIIEDPATELILDSNSTIKLGNNSSIIIRNGAKISASNAKFVSLNSNSTWNGIFIENAGINSIKNCLVENSTNGITVNNQITQLQAIQQSVEIAGCTFKNSTSSLLSYAIHVTNFANILIKDNLIQSTNITNGFSNGISLEYCPAENINVIGNNINNSLTGINIVQTSPYLSRNQITGSNNSDYGVFLDNSNGLIKNNNINNFKYSICMYYSSPYLLKNNFNNADISNLELNSNSIPFMSPLNSGNSLNWISGNNYLNGYPNASGISFSGESYPGIENGYNIIAVNGALYMKGSLPSSLKGFMPGTLNNWQDEQPIVNNFQTDNGNVIYDPTFDGINVPGYDSYELSDIGFGLLDTLFVKDLNNSIGGELLFLQAYKHEKQGQYIQAISKYKQLLNNYKNNIFAYNSLAHIFNCLEKSKSNNGQYISHQNYLTQIKNNTQYSKEIRELAEDFIIKSKLRRSLIDEAISDYSEIYLQNQNTPKGIHALINKESLVSLKQDTTDGISNPLRYKNHLLSALNKDNSKKINNGNNIPVQFEMFGNYPNPFNPQTNIKFGLPIKSFVTIKIYNISGKEIETLVDGFVDAGYHTLLFNASKYSSGIYFYKLVSNNNVYSGKMVLIK